MTKEKPLVFYHGTQTAIHLSDKPFLDPSLAKGGCPGDPDVPHIFVTPDKDMAMIYSLKAKNMSALGRNRESPFIVFHGEPQLSRGGWIYQCTEPENAPFQQVMFNGHGTGRWYSTAETNIAEPEAIPDLQTVMKEANLQAFVVDESKISQNEWLDLFSKEGAGHQEGIHFLQKQIAEGTVRHLNAESGINPDSRYIPKKMEAALKQYRKVEAYTPATGFPPVPPTYKNSDLGRLKR